MKENSINEYLTGEVAGELLKIYSLLIAKHENPIQYRLQIIKDMEAFMPMDNVPAMSIVVKMHYDLANDYAKLALHTQALDHFIKGLVILKGQTQYIEHPYIPAITSYIEKTAEALFAKVQKHLELKEFQAMADISTKLVDAMKYAFPQGHEKIGQYLGYKGLGLLYSGRCEEALGPLAESKSLVKDSGDTQRLQEMIKYCGDIVKAVEVFTEVYSPGTWLVPLDIWEQTYKANITGGDGIYYM